MNPQSETVAITIDHQLREVPKGLTILQAAQRSGIYIPTLCAHKDLSPFGGCRLCIVEVEGLRGFPTSCTTPVQDGMVIRTHTAQLQAVRGVTLRLILSEHPCSCLICDEKEECKKNVGTIRKAGVTTGCRYCSNDGQCELQEVVEKTGVTEVDYPVYYRHLQVKKADPFFDRDYNLCIVCGRCVRMCQEVRAANTLAFTQRGRATVIGPAYDRSHLEAGCEFCGACVSVCPTGALSEKTRKWDGPPESEQITQCPFCDVGCRMRLLIKGDRVIGSLPAEDPLVNAGQLCVKGRFCVTELVGSHLRLTKPSRLEDSTRVEISWDEAVELAAGTLSACPPEQFALLISPDSLNEDLYVAQKFARVVMRSNNVDTSARLTYRSGFDAYLNLMKMAVPLADVREASAILCIGLDARFGGSVVGVAIRQAIKKGARIVTIHPRDHSLALIANTWIQPIPGQELDFLNALVRLTERGATAGPLPRPERTPGGIPSELVELAEMLRDASRKMILVGSEFLTYRESPEILGAIAQLAHNVESGVFPVSAQGNLVGTVLTGAYPELLPGPFPSNDKIKLAELGKMWGADLGDLSSGWTSEALVTGDRIRTLYLIGEVPFKADPPADFLIFQNIYPPPASYKANLVLPSVAFSETDGTLCNVAGRIQRVRKAVNPRGEALPDWEILCRIARKMGFKGFDFRSAGEIHQEISLLVEGFTHFQSPDRASRARKYEGSLPAFKTVAAGPGAVDAEFPFILTSSISEHTYRGFPISVRVDGAKELFAEATVEMNPEDAAEAGINAGDKVSVISPIFNMTRRARIVKSQAKGRLHVSLSQGESGGADPHPARVVKSNV